MPGVRQSTSTKGSDALALLAQLGALVEADYGAAERLRVQQLFGPHREGMTTVADVCRFLACLASLQGAPREAVYHWAGAGLTRPTFEAHPQWSALCTATVPTLLQVGQLAPLALQSWLPSAACPEFAQQYVDGHSVQFVFDGPDELLWLMEGVVQGVGKLFGETVEHSGTRLPAVAAEGASGVARWQLTVRVRPDRRRATRLSRLPAGLSSQRRRS